MEVEREHEGNLSLLSPARQWRNDKSTLVTTVLSLHQTSEWFDPGRSQASEGLNIEMFQVLLLLGGYLKYQLKSLVSLGCFSTSAGGKSLALDFILILLRKWWCGTSYFIFITLHLGTDIFWSKNMIQARLRYSTFHLIWYIKLKCTHTRPAQWPYQLAW